MRLLWVLLFLTVPLGGVISFVAAAVSTGAWLPPNISTTGQSIDRLFYIILWITGIIFVLTEALLVYGLYAARGKENGKGAYVHGHAGLEVSWTALTALILAFVAFYQIPIWAKAKYVSTFKSDFTDMRPHALVTASQFLWQVRYPFWDEKAKEPKRLDPINPSYTDSFELINELHVPPTAGNEQNLLFLASRDVIHSFWVPAARVKQDALPGNVIPVWFGANQPGDYEWVCAELCGWGHYRMRGKVVVHATREDYNQWLREKTAEVVGAKAKK